MRLRTGGRHPAGDDDPPGDGGAADELTAPADDPAGTARDPAGTARDQGATTDAATTDGEATPPATTAKRRPLYPRLLRLRNVHPNAWQRAALGEGALAAAAVLVLADLASAWTLLVLPLGVAAVVKAHDLLAGVLPGGPGTGLPGTSAGASGSRSTDSTGTDSTGTGSTDAGRPRGAGPLAALRRRLGPPSATSDETPADDDGAGPARGPAPSDARG